MEISTQNMLEFALSNPDQAVGCAIIAGFGVLGFMRAIPMILGFVAGMSIRSVTGMVGRTVATTAKFAAGKKAAYPVTATECANYKPVKGHTFLWPDGITKTVVKNEKSKSDGLQVICELKNGQRCRTPLSEFRRQIVNARGVV